MRNVETRLRRLERILEFSRELTSTVSLEPLLHKIVKAAAELTGSEMAAILLLDGHTGELRFVASSNLLDKLFDIPVPFDESIAGAALSSGKPLIVPDARADPRHYKVVDQLIGFETRSLLAVPLQFQDRRIGVLEAENKRDGDEFDQQDVETLTALAAQATVAIENARLVEALQKSHDESEHRVEERTDELLKANAALKKEVAERVRAEEALQRRNRELAALNAITQALSTSLELQDILDQALARAVNALGFVGGLIALTDERTGELALFSHAGLPQPLIEHLQTQGLSDDLCGSAYIKDLHENTQANEYGLLEMGLQSCASAPIACHDRTLGIFCLFDTAPHSFSETDHTLLTAIGQQIGVAVENARLFRDVVRERQASYTLLNTAKALSTTLDFDKLLERILDELQHVAPYDTASISMLRDERGWTIAVRGLEHALARRFVLEDRPLVQRIVRAGEPVIVPDVRQEPDLALDEASAQARARLGAPLIAKGEIIGVLIMNSRHPYTYDKEAAHRAFAFAHQVALAIENSRLYGQVQAKLREANLLHSVTTALSFTLDLDLMLPYVARSLCEILNGTSVEIYGLSEQGDQPLRSATVALIAGYATPGSTEAEKKRRLAQGQTCTLADLPAMAEALAQRRPAQVQEDDPKADPHVQASLKARDARAMLLLPMVAGDRVLGFAQVWESKSHRRFTTGEIATGQTLVHQAAITIDNARLVEALRQRTIELQARNEELDAFAHTVAHDLKTPLTSLIGFGNLLEQRLTEMSEEELRDNLQMMIQSGHKMNTIIGELFLLTSVRKMEKVEMAPLDMAYIVAETRARLGDVLKRHQVEIIMPEDWPVALGRGPWVEEVWVNYISNAVKYGGRPDEQVPPRIELGFDELVKKVRFWVRDNGPGLTPEEQAQMFTPFTRLNQARAKGHGLGLSIVQRIVEKMDGQVGVESAPGQGSVFFFTLPIAPI